MLKFFKTLIHAKSKAFIGGVAGGGFVGWELFIARIPFQADIVVYVVKVTGAVFLAFCTGIASALGKDFIDYRKQLRKIKKQKEDAKKFKEDQKDIWRKNGTTG